MMIKQYEDWFVKNNKDRTSKNSSLCEEICDFLQIVDKELSLVRNVRLISNQKVIFPVQIETSYAVTVIESKKQGNLVSLPTNNMAKLILNDCGVVSLYGSVKKAVELQLRGNRLETLDFLPECEDLDVSFNPLKDISAIENKNIKKLTLSLGDLDEDSVITMFKSALKTQLKELVIVDNVTSQNNKKYALSEFRLKSFDSIETRYILPRHIIEIFVLEYDLKKQTPQLQSIICKSQVVKY